MLISARPAVAMINIPITSPVRKGRHAAILTGNTFHLIRSSGGRIALQLMLIPALARILTPDAFGLIAIAMPVVIFTTILAEAGLVTGLARAQIDLKVESSVFWFSAAVGLTSAIAIAALAVPLSLAAGQPKLLPVLLALSPSLLIAGLTIVPSARLQRTGRFATLGGVELFAAAIAAATALATALNGWNAFSLVAQQLVLAAARLAGGMACSRYKPTTWFRYPDVQGVLRQSGSMVGANLLAYLSRSLDNLLIGFFIGARSLGFYASAYQVIQIPEYVLGASARTTTLPAMAQATTPEEAAAVYFSSLRLLAAIATPVAIGCGLEADNLVGVLLGKSVV